MILLIDSSSKKVEFGIADDMKILYKEELDPGNNADMLTYFIKRAIDERGIEFGDIRYVSLSNGPGSFTGLRIGSAIAKGICFALGCNLIEIPTLDIIASKGLKFSEISESAEFDPKKITSLIFSNTRSLEFYYCEYEIISGKLIRISEYKTDLSENIIKDKTYAVINEEMKMDFDPGPRNRVTDVSKIPNLNSQYDLTKECIRNNRLSDYRTSEPFYMMGFAPQN